MRRFALEEIVSMVFIAILFIIIVGLFAPIHAEEYVDAKCWEESLGVQECRVYADSDKIWLLTLGDTRDYIVMDIVEIDGTLYVLLLKKEDR